MLRTLSGWGCSSILALVLLLSPFAGAAPAKEDKQAPSEPEETSTASAAQSAESTLLANLAPAPAASPASTSEFQSVPSAPSPERPAPALAEWFMEWRYTVNHTDLKGNEDRSFLTEGVNHLAEYTFLHKRPVWGIRQMETLGIYRYTDDFRIDPEVNTLQRAYLRLSGPTFEANFGDSLANYSRFSFNQNIKGINAWKRLPVGPGLRLVGTAGVFQDRWGSIFKDFEEFTDPASFPDPTFPTKPYTRLVAGARAEQYLSEDSFVALSYSQGSDLTRTLPRRALLRPVDNQLVSIDTDLHWNRDFRLGAELAYSFTQFDARFQREKKSDYAGRFEVSHRWKRIYWRVDYARFMPNFFSVNSRQVQDLQDASGRLSVDLTPDISLDSSFRYTNDNLDGTPIVVFNTDRTELEALTNPGRAPDLDGDGIPDLFPFIVDQNGAKRTTFVRVPEIRLLFRRLPPNRNLQLSVGYRQRQVETSNKASFDPNTGDPLFTDRLTRIPFVDLTWSLQSSIFSFSYEYRHNRDSVRRADSTFTNRFAASYRGTYFWGDWIVSPSFRFETEPESRRILRTGQDLRLSPLLLDFPGRDQTRTLQGSLIVDFPRYFVLETLYRELNAELLSPFILDGERLFGNGGYKRPYFRGALTYKIRNSEDHFVVVSYERGVNTFLTPDPTAVDTRSFRENVFQLAVVIRWRR